MDQMRDKCCDHALMIKRIDPGALILGPEEWGWLGYLYSGYDLWDWGSFTDRAAHGDLDLMPWLLAAMNLRSQQVGLRLLDVFTLHYYPQGGEFGNNTSSALQLRRNRSTRSLWDPDYTDESWINSQVRLIPRMKEWVATNYPGTAIGITEYSWGADDHINGATAQADLLGIFGREGLDLATRWLVPPTGSPAFHAFQMFRNYDGHRSTFGNLNVRATAPDPDNLSAFAALRTDSGVLTVMVVSKVLSNTTPFTLTLTNFTAGGPAQAWQLTSNNVIAQLPNLNVTAGTLSNSLPPQSITLFLIPPVGDFKLRSGPVSAGQLELWLDGQANQSYVLQGSSNLMSWISISTNSLVSNSFRYWVPTTNATHRFYRSKLNAP